MAQISIPNGKVVYVSTYEYLFVLKDEDVSDFYQQLMAEDAGVPAPDDPFSFRKSSTKIDYEEDLEIDEQGEQE